MTVGVKYTSISWLRKNEQTAIDETIAMMSYNPSIGRVLRSGGVDIFRKIAVKKIGRLNTMKTQRDFDKFHNNFVRDVMKKIKRTSKKKKIHYGHGQKPVNVFLKVYVDWLSYPNRKIADRIRGFLHVPLDKWVMGYMKKERAKEYKRIVMPFYKDKNIRPSNFSLAIIEEDMYEAWQELFRKIYPKKPLLFDVIWARAPRKEKRDSVR
ncbi:hypothetical protein ES705_18806 [subsurface metagenome]